MTAQKIFISYAHADEAAMQELDKFLGPLERSGDISTWTDRKILPGQQWKEEIMRNLETADMILLLVSANFLASDFIHEEEIPRALQRMQQHGKAVIPIILNYCLWDYSPLASIQALPKDAQPIAGFPNPAQAWNEVARGVMARLGDMASSSSTAKNIQTEPSKEIMRINKTVADLVARADLRAALQLLAEHSPSAEVTQQQQRLSNLERNERMGTWSHDQASRERNKIALAILQLNDTAAPSGHSAPPAAPATGGTNITDSKNVVLGNITATNVYIGDRASGQPAQGPKGAAGQSPLPILMLTANPAGTTKLNLDKEHARIAEKLQGQPLRFALQVRRAVDATGFKEFTEQVKPRILHFSGHGQSGASAGIAVQNDDHNGQALLSEDALDMLFEYFAEEKLGIEMVVLNACYSQAQAQAIARHVPHVVGTTLAITDEAAIAFSTGFYFKLAETDLDYAKAFKSGRTQAAMMGAPKDCFVRFEKGAQQG